MKTEVLDLREDLRKGLAPFAKIMTAAGKVQPGDALVLKTPFKPVPLFKVMEHKGFTSEVLKNAAGDWEIQFTRKGDVVVQPPVESTCGCSAPVPEKVIEVNARGLQPPQPLVTILEAVSNLPENTALLARTDRRPMHLYPELELRGFTSHTEEQPDGSYITYIQRA